MVSTTEPGLGELAQHSGSSGPSWTLAAAWGQILKSLQFQAEAFELDRGGGPGDVSAQKSDSVRFLQSLRAVAPAYALPPPSMACWHILQRFLLGTLSGEGGALTKAACVVDGTKAGQLQERERLAQAEPPPSVGIALVLHRALSQGRWLKATWIC